MEIKGWKNKYEIQNKTINTNNTNEIFLSHDS